jgi:uncharacterized membrane protein
MSGPPPKDPRMHHLALFLHLAAAIFWMGGMAFMVMALRPALQEQLGPSQRLPLMVSVLKRFFAVVAASIAVLLLTGIYMLLDTGGTRAPPGWHAMAGLGLVMMLIFGHIFFAPYRRMKLAIACADWPEAGRRAGQIALLVKINLGLGWLAIAAVMFWR